MKKVLIICSGNSCRSIMAEALINHELKENWQAYSAGTYPSRVHPLSLQTLQERGIPTDNLRSKSLSEFWDRDDLDLLVTVCDHAEKNCPVFLHNIPKIHMAFADPVHYNTSDPEQALSGFREVLDDLQDRLLGYLKKHS